MRNGIEFKVNLNRFIKNKILNWVNFKSKDMKPLKDLTLNEI